MGIADSCQQCCSGAEAETIASKALLRELRLNIAGQDRDQFKELLMRHADAEKVQLADLDETNDKSTQVTSR